jgi:hypothetical protein
VLFQPQIEALIDEGVYRYQVAVQDYEESLVRGVLYLIEITDPKSHKWIVRKSFSECEGLHLALMNHLMEENQEQFIFPTKITKMFPKKDDYLQVCGIFTVYFTALFNYLEYFSSECRELISKFIDVKILIIPKTKVQKRAESVPNPFLKLKKEFSEQLVAKNAIKDSTESDRLIKSRLLIFIQILIFFFFN